MTASHQSGPHYIGPDEVRGEPSAQGAVVLTQKYDLTVTDQTTGVAFEAFRAPADTELVNMRVLVVTASNAVTSASLKLTDGSSDIITGFDLKSTAGSYLSVTNGDGTVASASLFLSPAGGTEKNLSLLMTEVGGAATVGRVVIYLDYIQKA